MTGEEHDAPARPYTLQEANEACLGRGPAAADPPKLTVEDAVLLLLHANPLPLRGKGDQVRRALVAAARALRGSGVEPILFSEGRQGPSAAHIDDAVEQLAFSNKVRVFGGKGDRDIAVKITPRGRAAIKEKHESLSPAARAELAQIRAGLGAQRPRSLATRDSAPPQSPSGSGTQVAKEPDKPGARRALEERPAPGGDEAARLQRYVDRGDRLLEEGRYDEAYANYKLAAGLRTPGAGLHLRMARSMAEMGLYKDALRHCRAAIRADPAGAAGYAAAGHCLHKLGRHAEAFQYSSRATLRDPSNPKMYSLCGAILSRLGRHAEAVSYYQRAAMLDPCSVQARQNASFSMFKLGRYEEALRQVEEAARMSPEDPMAHARIANCLSRMGRHEEAIPAIRRAIEAAPGRADSYLSLLGALFELGRHEEALEWCRRAAKACPGDPRPHYATAIALRALGRQEEALPHCERSIELDPHNTDFRAAMSYLLRDLKRLTEALSHCKAAVSAEPCSLPALSNMGSMLADLGRHDEAHAYLDKAIRIDPQQPVPRYNRALSLQKTGDLCKALEEYRRVVKLDSGNAGAYNNMGVVLSTLGRNGEALAHFDRAIELNPGNAAAHLNKALSLQLLGLHRDALAHFDRALELSPGNADAHVGRLSCLDELGLADKKIGHYAGKALDSTMETSGAGSGAAGQHAVAGAAAAAAASVAPRPSPAPGAATGSDRAQRVKPLLSKDESKTLEFKSWPDSRPGCHSGSSKMKETIARELCSLVNTEGGDLLIGVGDGGDVEGLAPGGRLLSRKKRDEMQAWLTNVIVDYFGAEHDGRFDREIAEVDGLDVLHCAVAASKDGPVVLKKRLGGKDDFFMRAGSSCRALGSKGMLEYVNARWPEWGSRPQSMERLPMAGRGDDMSIAALGGRDADLWPEGMPERSRRRPSPPGGEREAGGQSRA